MKRTAEEQELKDLQIYRANLGADPGFPASYTAPEQYHISTIPSVSWSYKIFGISGADHVQALLGHTVSIFAQILNGRPSPGLRSSLICGFQKPMILTGEPSEN